MARVGQTPVAATTRRKVRDRATTLWGGSRSFPLDLLGRDGSLPVSRIAADFRGVFSPATIPPVSARAGPCLRSVATIRDARLRSARVPRRNWRPETPHARHTLSRRWWWRSLRATALAGPRSSCNSPTTRRNVARRTLGVTTGAEPCQTAVCESRVRGWVLTAAVCGRL